MNVLMVTPEYPPNCGGIGWYVFYLSSELSALGNNVSIVVRSPRKIEPYGPFAVQNIDVGIIPPFNAYKMVRKINNYVINKPYDIAIVHSTPIGSWLKNIPTILVPHWCIAEGHKSFYKGACDFHSLLHRVFKGLYIFTEKKSVSNVKMIATVSKAMKKEIFNHYNKEAVYVGNAVNTDIFTPSIKKNNRGVLLPSMLRSGKGVREAIEVLKAVRKKGCDIPFTFIGSGPMKSWLLEQIDKQSLSNVDLLPPVEHSKLKDLYKDYSIVFLPSYYEGLPTVILEAMASGLSVVATDVGGTSEAILHGETGFVHKVDDLEGMGDSILLLDNDANLKEKFGIYARQRVCEHFNWNDLGKRFQTIMEKIL